MNKKSAQQFWRPHFSDPISKNPITAFFRKGDRPAAPRAISFAGALVHSGGAAGTLRGRGARLSDFRSLQCVERSPWDRNDEKPAWRQRASSTGPCRGLRTNKSEEVKRIVSHRMASYGLKPTGWQSLKQGGIPAAQSW